MQSVLDSQVCEYLPGMMPVGPISSVVLVGHINALTLSERRWSHRNFSSIKCCLTSAPLSPLRVVERHADAEGVLVADGHLMEVRVLVPRLVSGTWAIPVRAVMLVHDTARPEQRA